MGLLLILLLCAGCYWAGSYWGFVTVKNLWQKVVDKVKSWL